MAIRSVIESLGAYLPQGRLSTKELIEGCKVKPAIDLEKLTGIKRRPVVGDNEYSLDLAVQAVSKCLEISRYSPEDMDMVICANICRLNGPNFKANYEPCSAVQLARHFDFNGAITFDVSNACAGMFTAATVMDAYIRAGLIRRGLVVSGEYITHLARNAQKEISSSIDPQFASLTVGDSGAAIILDGSDDPDIGFHGIEVFTVAEHADLCVGTVSKEEHGGYVMYADSSKIHTNAIAMSAEHVGSAVKGTRWERSENHHYIMHQTAVKAISTMGKAVNSWVGSEVCTRENSIVNLEDRGNSASTAHFIALWDHIKNGAIRSGDNILFAVQASGINLGVAMYTLDDLPERILAVEEAGYAEAVNA